MTQEQIKLINIIFNIFINSLNCGALWFTFTQITPKLVYVYNEYKHNSNEYMIEPEKEWLKDRRDRNILTFIFIGILSILPVLKILGFIA